jgi:transposase
MSEEKPMIQTDSTEEPKFAAFVAIDWADQKHAWSLQAAGSDQRQADEVKHTPEAVGAWVSMLSARFPGQPIAVALEQSHGALVFMLGQFADLHLYPIHPRAAAQFRAALYPSGAKDDPVDADLLLDMLMLHRKHIRPLRPDNQPTRLVQHQVQARRRLVNEKTRQVQRLTAKLKVYFPQVLDWFDKMDSPLVGALLHRWPTLPDLQRARPGTIRSFCRQHNCRDAERIEERIQKIRQAVPAITDAAVIQPAVTVTRNLVELIATLRTGIAKLDQQIATVTAEHPDFGVFDSFPGAGPVLAPRLLAAFGSCRERYATADEVQKLSGIAPVMKRSGKAESVHFRRACPKFLRQTFHEWAGHSIAFCDWARVFYQQQRHQGHDHHAAVRALAFKWIRIAFRCWHDGVPYDDARYVASLRRHGSPLAAALNAVSAPK